MDLANLDLKSTINLPKTAFSMKANLPQTEPKMLARWEAENLYGQIRAARAGNFPGLNPGMEVNFGQEEGDQGPQATWVQAL